MIQSVGHDQHSAILEIEFDSRAVWQYYDFAESDYHEFINSDSLGRYFRSNIKGEYSEYPVDC